MEQTEKFILVDFVKPNFAINFIELKQMNACRQNFLTKDWQVHVVHKNVLLEIYKKNMFVKNFKGLIYFLFILFRDV